MIILGQSGNDQSLNADKVGQNLWVGGIPLNFDAVEKNFDALVLAAREHQDFFPVHQHPKLYVIHAPIDDSKPTREEKAQALLAGLQVYELNKAGKKVLVTCAAGVNRSALIAGLAMVISGLSADTVISQIRQRRKPVSGATPLFNNYFVKFLKDIDESLSNHTH